ncbi:MAG TPA: type II secretion system major pseudopilin GspG [Gemmatimonadales bacterium]|nr:type II secretion system major pseudopilin GspG [Gemmatimonadales bacterium]
MSSGRRAPPFGFTLIEIIVVITVIAILAAVVSPMVFRNVGDAKTAAAHAQVEIFGLALDAYRMDNDYYPSTSQGLEALVALPAGDPPARNWRGPYLKKGIPLDPWQRPYAYRGPDETRNDMYELQSLGRDGAPGGTGEDLDIMSWTSAAKP